jgi:hypothetical protein
MSDILSFYINDGIPYLEIISDEIISSEGKSKILDLREQKLISPDCQCTPTIHLHNLPGISNYILSLGHNMDCSETSDWFHLHYFHHASALESPSITLRPINKIRKDIFFDSRYPGKLNWFFGENRHCVDNEIYLIKVDNTANNMSVEKFPCNIGLSNNEYVAEYNYSSRQKELDEEGEKVEGARREKINLHICHDQLYDHVDNQCGCKYNNGDPVISTWTFNYAVLKLNETTPVSHASSSGKRYLLGDFSYCEDNRVYCCEQLVDDNKKNVVIFKEMTVDENDGKGEIEERRVVINSDIISDKFSDVYFYPSSQDTLVLECFV